MALIKTAKSNVEIQDEALQKFKLDEASSDHILDLLVSAYAKPQFSGLRELIQNGLDAAPGGQVMITMPTSLDPMLVVQDFGGGLTADGFRDMIGSVGASDKRGDETKAGCLGIGSLAPMSFAEAMTMVSRQEKQKTTLHVYKDDSGKLGYTISGPEKDTSGEPDGMTVSVPVPEDMIEAVQEGLDVFRFSPDICKRLLVGGVPLKPYHTALTETVKVGAHEVMFRIVEGQTDVLKGALVLLNGLPMAAAFERFAGLRMFEQYLSSRETNMRRNNRYCMTTLVITVPPKAGLSFPPSREVVAATRLNATFLSNAVNRYYEKGCASLAKDGVQIGSETPIALKWYAEAAAKNRSLSDCRVALETELNKISGALRVELRTDSIYSGGRQIEIPRVTLLPRLPESMAPRYLDISTVILRRSHSRRARMQTRECVPVDYNRPSLGFKHPWDASSAFTVLTWDKLEEKYDNDWSKVMGRNRVAKQYLFELAMKDKGLNTYEQNRILLAKAPLPENHPLQPLATHVDFQDILDEAAPLSSENPYAGTDDEEVSEDGTIMVGERVRHPRDFLYSSGISAKLGLPKDLPFMYIEVLRDNVTSDNCSGLASKLSTWGLRKLELSSVLKFLEATDMAEDLCAVYLRPGEVRSIKRNKVKLMDAASTIVKLWLEERTEEEKSWLFYAMFRVLLKKRAPYFAKFLERLHNHHAGSDHPLLAKLLIGWDAPPTPAMETFLHVFETHVEEEKWSVTHYEQFLDPTAEHALQYKSYDVSVGFPTLSLSKPWRTLRAWFRTGTKLSRIAKTYLQLEHVASTRPSLNLAEHSWAEPETSLDEEMDGAFEVAELTLQ